MQTVLSVISVIAIAVTAEALVCRQCDTYLGDNCKEYTDEICPSHVNRCFTQVMRETMYGISFYQSKRGCAVDKNTCNAHINMTVGEYTSIERLSYCCEGDYCNAGPVIFETPKERKKNGLRCPSCFGRGFACQEKVIDCRGLQDQCYHFDGEVFSGEHFEQWVIKGCSNKKACEYNPDPKHDLPFFAAGFHLECSQPHKPHNHDKPLILINI